VTVDNDFYGDHGHRNNVLFVWNGHCLCSSSFEAEVNMALITSVKELCNARRLSICLSLCLYVSDFTGRIDVKFYHRCNCGQGRTDQILEIIQIRIRIQGFFEGFFNIAR